MASQKQSDIGTLLILKTKRGFASGIKFKDGKKIPFPELKPKNDALNNTEVEVTREKGRIVQVKNEGGILYNSTQSKPLAKPIKKTRGYKIIPAKSSAKSPYNFIPLNKDKDKDTVKSDRLQDKVSLNDFDSFCHKSGYIDCDLATLTPLYIRDTIDKTQIDEFLKSEKSSEDKTDEKGKKFIVPNFFSPGGKLRIPGSSLRGMVRNLVEIVSWGNFGFTDEDKRLYFRSLADKSRNFRQEYQKRMTSYDGVTRKTQYKMNAGYLKKEGMDEYIIIPAQKRDGKQFRQVLQKNTSNSFDHEKRADGYLVVSGKMQNKKKDWVVYPPDYTVNSIEISPEDIEDYKNDTLRIKDADLLSKIDRFPEGIPCFYVVYTDAEKKQRISFGHTAMFRLAYRHKISELIYDEPNEEKRLAKPDIAHAIFGYASKIDNKKNNKDKDICAGRVFFEDALLIKQEEEQEMNETIPQILSSPKPTAFQMYLEQSGSDGELNHYDTKNAKIRGNKMYWHKKDNKWQALEISCSKKAYKNALISQNMDESLIKEFVEFDKEKVNIKIETFNPNNPEYLDSGIFEFLKEILRDKKSQNTIIKPVKPGTSFKFRIRFENLTQVELGALLFVLKLPNPDECNGETLDPDYAHKLGMGKPLGLGSIYINPRLVITDRSKRYKKLFKESPGDEDYMLWEDGSNSDDEKGSTDAFIEEFAKYVIDSSGVSSVNSLASKSGDKYAGGKSKALWNTSRLSQLKAMLMYKNSPPPENIRYMEIEKVEKVDRYGRKTNEFKDRRVLPYPSEVLFAEKIGLFGKAYS
ncbi:MAG: TIGR03986 family CRISPR-associated RAMP protein [Candidatus Eremiobacteraeota bacterium]|nr:TIGR03986 family CRISPR-associated RAMP protein [Candidatus Eremiobacteraeota bacterium]